jgi:hypothetical protein
MYYFSASVFGEDSGEDSDEDLFSDTDSLEEALFGDSKAEASRVPAEFWLNMPDDLLKNILSFLGPGHFLYVSLVCYEFYTAYLELWLSVHTTWRSAAESFQRAELARVLYKNTFLNETRARMYVISWAIRMNLPKVLKKLCTHGWFENTNADMFAEHGQVEVLLWLGLQGFCDFCSPRFHDALTAFYDPKNGTIRMEYLVRYVCRRDYSFPTLTKDPVIEKGILMKRLEDSIPIVSDERFLEITKIK